KTQDYQGYARALFGFQEAVTMWGGNARARAGISEAKLAYAQCAKQRGDFELGASLLDANNSEHQSLRQQLQAAQRERDAPPKWLTGFRGMAAAMAVIVVGVILAALVLVNSAKNDAVAQRDLAERAQKQEAIQKKYAEEEAERAVKAEKAAKTAEAAAV